MHINIDIYLFLHNIGSPLSNYKNYYFVIVNKAEKKKYDKKTNVHTKMC